MSVKSQVSKALSVVLPGGALGASIVLALMTQSPVAEATSVAGQPDAAGSIAGQLAVIRSGVSVLSDESAAAGSAEPAVQGDAAKLVPTWWGNGGWGRWRFGWGNGGWPNWHNGWHNGWHNWGNGGWHNFWHNW